MNKDFASLIEALRLYSKATGGTDGSVSQVLTFLAVAEKELPMADIAQITDVVLSSVSRNVSRIGPGPNPDTPGEGLVESFEDPWNRKRKLVRLTAKGRNLAAGMQAALNGKQRSRSLS